MGAPSRKKSVKKLVIMLSLSVVAITGFVAMTVVPPLIFKYRVTEGLHQIMNTPVEVDRCDIALNLSSGYIKGIAVHNPDGFKGARFLEIPRITFQLDTESIGSDMLHFKYITIHNPVLHLETKGETSNLKEMITLMFSATATPDSNVHIDTLYINNGTIRAVFEYGDGTPIISAFPLKEIKGLKGNAGRISGQLSLELQKEMDAQLKNVTEGIDIFQSFKDMFK